MTPIRILAALALMTASAQADTVTVSPAAKTLIPGASQRFKATVTGPADTAVTWMVNGIPGGTPDLGLISARGLYTAPILPTGYTTVEIEAEATQSPLTHGAASVKRKAFVPVQTSYWVATSGNDASDGSQAHPWRTIQHALNTANGGSVIRVESGIYNALVTVKHSGSAKGFTILTAAPGAKPVIDGTGLGI